MSRPNPFYLFSSPEDQIKTINLIYDQGWYVGFGLSRARAMTVPWAYGVAYSGGAFWAAHGEETTGRVNSAAHLIAYCKTLDPQPSIRKDL